MRPQIAAEKNAADRHADLMAAIDDLLDELHRNRFVEAEKKSAEGKAATTAAIDHLPASLGRNRILDAETSAAFWGVSLSHWRRLYRTGGVPPPIKIGQRKLGWRVGDLVDELAKRAEVA
jgi:predicted DNA-binding transcriptional regulator AlpA